MCGRYSKGKVSNRYVPFGRMFANRVTRMCLSDCKEAFALRADTRACTW